MIAVVIFGREIQKKKQGHGRTDRIDTSTYGNVNLGSQGTGVNAGLGAGLNVGIGDSWNFNPFMNLDASFMGGQMNTGIRGGARLSYMFKEGGKTPNYISQLDQLIL